MATFTIGGGGQGNISPFLTGKATPMSLPPGYLSSAQQQAAMMQKAISGVGADIGDAIAARAKEEARSEGLDVLIKSLEKRAQQSGEFPGTPDTATRDLPVIPPPGEEVSEFETIEVGPASTLDAKVTKGKPGDALAGILGGDVAEKYRAGEMRSPQKEAIVKAMMDWEANMFGEAKRKLIDLELEKALREEEGRKAFSAAQQAVFKDRMIPEEVVTDEFETTLGPTGINELMKKQARGEPLSSDEFDAIETLGRQEEFETRIPEAIRLKTLEEQKERDATINIINQSLGKGQLGSLDAQAQMILRDAFDAASEEEERVNVYKVIKDAHEKLGEPPVIPFPGAPPMRPGFPAVEPERDRIQQLKQGFKPKADGSGYEAIVDAQGFPMGGREITPTDVRMMKPEDQALYSDLAEPLYAGGEMVIGEEEVERVIPGREKSVPELRAEIQDALMAGDNWTPDTKKKLDELMPGVTELQALGVPGTDLIQVYEVKDGVRSKLGTPQKRSSSDLREFRVDVLGPTAVTRDKTRADKLRQGISDIKFVDNSVRRLLEISKSEGTEEVNIKLRGEAKALQQTLIGRLRVSLLGPGVMTEKDAERIIAAIPDPTAIFALDTAQEAALTTTLKSIRRGLVNDIETHIEGGLGNVVLPDWLQGAGSTRGATGEAGYTRDSQGNLKLNK